MTKIALTGGIACGKSLLSSYLNACGVETIDADEVTHGLIPNPAERRRIAAEVFADPVKRRALESRLHPLIKAKIDAFLSSPPPSLRSPLRLAVIPLLFEVHWEENFDIICCVTSSRANQIDRMMRTRGYTREEAEARLAAQMPVSEKAAKSHYVIENDGTAEELRAKVVAFVDWLNGQIKQ